MRELAVETPAIAELALDVFFREMFSWTQMDDFSAVPPTQEYPSLTDPQSVVHSRSSPGSQTSSPVRTPSPHVD